MTMEKLLFNDILGMSLTTAILEAADWDESVASRISSIIRTTQPEKSLLASKEALRNRLKEENISKNIIDNIFILVELEESRIKSRPKLWNGIILSKLEK